MAHAWDADHWASKGHHQRPICSYCHRNCFVRVRRDDDWPWFLLADLEKIEFIASCLEGQERDKAAHNVCWVEIAAAIKEPWNCRDDGRYICPACINDGSTIHPDSHQADPCVHCSFVYHDKCFYTQSHPCVREGKIKERINYGVKL